jgi:hypothetical protein
MDAEHDHVLGPVQVADDVGDLGDQFRIGGELERLQQGWRPCSRHTRTTILFLTPGAIPELCTPLRHNVFLRTWGPDPVR